MHEHDHDDDSDVAHEHGEIWCEKCESPEYCVMFMQFDKKLKAHRLIVCYKCEHVRER